MAKLLLYWWLMHRSLWLSLWLIGTVTVPSAFAQSEDTRASDGQELPSGYRFEMSVEAVHLTVTVTKKRPSYGARGSAGFLFCALPTSLLGFS